MNGVCGRRYVRALKHQPSLPRGKWHALWDELEVAHRALDLIWAPHMARELQAVRAAELADLDRDAAEAAARV